MLFDLFFALFFSFALGSEHCTELGGKFVAPGHLYTADGCTLCACGNVPCNPVSCTNIFYCTENSIIYNINDVVSNENGCVCRCTRNGAVVCNGNCPEPETEAPAHPTPEDILTARYPWGSQRTCEVCPNGGTPVLENEGFTLNGADNSKDSCIDWFHSGRRNRIPHFLCGEAVLRVEQICGGCAGPNVPLPPRPENAVDGGWTEWEDCRCDVTYFGGKPGIQERTCTNPVPIDGGDYCDGDALRSCSDDCKKGGKGKGKAKNDAEDRRLREENRIDNGNGSHSDSDSDYVPGWAVGALVLLSLLFVGLGVLIILSIQKSGSVERF